MTARIQNAPWNLSTQNVQNHFETTEPHNYEDGGLFDNIWGDIQFLREQEEAIPGLLDKASDPEEVLYDYGDVDYHMGRVDDCAYYLQALLDFVPLA